MTPPGAWGWPPGQALRPRRRPDRTQPPARDYAALAELLAGAVEADPSGAAQAALNRAAGTLGAELGTEAARHTAADGNPDEVLAALR